MRGGRGPCREVPAVAQGKSGHGSSPWVYPCTMLDWENEHRQLINQSDGSDACHEFLLCVLKGNHLMIANMGCV
jgi:hypothetical protein